MAHPNEAQQEVDLPMMIDDPPEAISLPVIAPFAR